MKYKYGERLLNYGCVGDDVIELQIRLAGFSGGVPDGDYGKGTVASVRQFQKDVMKNPDPSGVVDRKTFLALNYFGYKFPISWEGLACPCSTDPQFRNGKYDFCDGFGKGLGRNEYRRGMPKVERYHQYEYPGIHRMVLWAAKACMWYFPDWKFTVNCGYRCHVRNVQKGRLSTNHFGKAIDLDVPRTNSEGVDLDKKRCNVIRKKLVEKSGAQIGWKIANKKALEPSNIAPTWVHYDVRCFDKKYLLDSFFVKNQKDCDNVIEILLDKVVEEKKVGAVPRILRGFTTLSNSKTITPKIVKKVIIGVPAKKITSSWIDVLKSLFN